MDLSPGHGILWDGTLKIQSPEPNQPNPVCVCVCACVCAALKPWCKLSFNLDRLSSLALHRKTILWNLWLLWGPFQCSYRAQQRFLWEGCLLPGLLWKQPSLGRAQLHVRESKRKFLPEPKYNYPAWVTGGVGIFRFSKMHVEPFSVGTGKGSCSFTHFLQQFKC